MPVISCFFGIYVRMYHDDHNPPHFHVEYQGHEALMAIENGEILAGELPSKAIKLVQEWAKEHQQELLINWQLVGWVEARNPAFLNICIY